MKVDWLQLKLSDKVFLLTFFIAMMESNVAMTESNIGVMESKRNKKRKTPDVVVNMSYKPMIRDKKRAVTKVYLIVYKICSFFRQINALQ
jgi:hypothetical protein